MRKVFNFLSGVNFCTPETFETSFTFFDRFCYQIESKIYLILSKHFVLYVRSGNQQAACVKICENSSCIVRFLNTSI